MEFSTGILPCLLLGLMAGALSGMTGVGGGIFILPALVLLLGFPLQQAQGTTLAILVPPIDLLAAWTYYKHGDVNLMVAALVCLGFFVGGFIGARIGLYLPSTIVGKLFGVVLLLGAIKILSFNFSGEVSP